MSLNKKSYDSISKLKRYEIYPDIKGVYFLFQGDQIVYVGQSKNIHRRVADHISDKQFDSYTFIEEKLPGKRKALEAYYIEKFSPVNNISKPDSKELQKRISKAQKKSDNHTLIDRLYSSHKKAGTKKGFVYYKYLEKASYYCIQDLRYIASLLEYKETWINYKVQELKKLDKWK